MVIKLYCKDNERSRRIIDKFAIMKTSIVNGHPLQSYYSRIYKTYDLVNHLFTLGLDRKWRRFAAKACLETKPVQILDLCCGTGDLAISIAKIAGNPVHITGYDLNSEMLSVAVHKTAQFGLDIRYIQGNADSMPFENEKFDCITIGFGFRNLVWENPNRDQHIREIGRIMKKGGRLLILESSRPQNKMIAFFYRVYLKTILIPLGGVLSGNHEAYRYLAGSSSDFYSFAELRTLMEPHHLELTLRKKFLFGSTNLLIAGKKTA
jgi:demethylmenaquinone methyltransferase / 2-methoxy-6-polyprenyl-1,4-benzoquinol methylase